MPPYDPWQYANNLINPLTGLPKKKAGNSNPFDPSGQTLSPQQGLDLSNKLASSAAPNLAAAQYGTLGPPVGLGSTIKIPGYTPDYGKLLRGDEQYKSMLADLGAQGVADASARGAATQRALALLGFVPNFDANSGLNLEYLNQDVTPETRALAQRNTEAGLSVSARQQQQFEKNVRAVKNALAARGALRSGEAGYQLGEAQQQYDRAKFDTTQEILEYLAGLQAGYAERQRQAKLQERQESAGIMDRIRQANSAGGSQEAVFNAPAGMFRAADGSYWYGDNTPVPRHLWPGAQQATPYPDSPVDDRSDHNIPSAFRGGYVDEQPRPANAQTRALLASLGRSQRF